MTILYWFAILMTYVILQLVLVELTAPGQLEITLIRAYGHAFLVSTILAAHNVLLTFLAVLGTTLLVRWWFPSSSLSPTLLMVSMFPPLIVYQLLRYAGESRLIVGMLKLAFNVAIAMLVAYKAMLLGLRVQIGLYIAETYV
jgi:hypothetical protein